MEIPSYINWRIWRVWKTGRATLTEIRNNWNICDLWIANVVLDLEELAEYKQSKAIEERQALAKNRR